MGKGKQLNIRRVILFSSIILLVILFSVIGVAEYTKSSRGKRVIASMNAADVLFSSNYLSTFGPNAYSHKDYIYTGSEDLAGTATITVCNYAQGNPSHYYDRDISYKLKVRLVLSPSGAMINATSSDINFGNYGEYYYQDGSSYKKIKVFTLGMFYDSSHNLLDEKPEDWDYNFGSYYYLDGGNYKQIGTFTTGKFYDEDHNVLTSKPDDWDYIVRLSYIDSSSVEHLIYLSKTELFDEFDSSVLLHTRSCTDVYNVRFTPAFSSQVNGLGLHVTAELNGSYPQISSIDSIIFTKVSRTGISTVWTGYFSDDGALGVLDATDASDLDGYNYTISGSGATTVKLSWNYSKLDINQVFILSLVESITESDLTDSDSDGLYYIIFNVDSDEVNRYDTQFYRQSDNPSDYDSWSTVKGYVTFEDNIS